MPTLGIQWHVLAMYAPSFITGSLIARFGVERITGMGLGLIAAAAVVNIAGVTVAHFWSDWCCSAAAGTVLHRCHHAGDAVPPAARTQQGAGVQRLPHFRQHGAELILVRSVARDSWAGRPSTRSSSRPSSSQLRCSCGLRYGRVRHCIRTQDPRPQVGAEGDRSLRALSGPKDDGCFKYSMDESFSTLRLVYGLCGVDGGYSNATHCRALKRKSAEGEM